MFGDPPVNFFNYAVDYKWLYHGHANSYGRSQPFDLCYSELS